MDGFYLKIAEAVCLGASFGFSGLFHYLYMKSRTTVDMLDAAPRLTINGKLKDVLKVTPGACLQYAVIEGNVQPVGEPLTSHSQKEFVGVLQKFVLREHRQLWNSLSRSWMDSERVLHERVNMVPFVLVGPDETVVRVLCPLQASGVHTEFTHEKFHQANYSMEDIVGQYLTGEKLKGQLETEEMLKVGTFLTGIGQLVLDTEGTLTLQPSPNASQYFLSIAGFDALRRDQESVVGWWKALTVVSALLGATVLFWVGRRYYYHVKVRRAREQEIREFERLQAEAPRAPVSGTDALQDGAEEYIENACVICLARPRSCILLDCGHVCCCHSCYQNLPQHLCPICRQHIRRMVPLFHA